MHEAVASMDDDLDPVRTCAGCRQRDAQDALLRFAIVQDEPRLVPDLRRKLGGRGVSVHPTRACVTRAVERGGFAKAVGAKPKLDAASLCEMAAGQYERRLEGLLVSARRARALGIGTEAVRRALDSGAAALLFVATDAAGRRDELAQRGERDGVPTVSFWNKAELGRLMGRDEVGVMAILDARLAGEVAATAARATQLSEAE
jgi:predicted RNA-binding protein YlxR (DUF448 family)